VIPQQINKRTTCREVASPCRAMMILKSPAIYKFQCTFQITHTGSYPSTMARHMTAKEEGSVACSSFVLHLPTIQVVGSVFFLVIFLYHRRGFPGILEGMA